MKQKWNLQDIVPPERAKKGPSRPTSMSRAPASRSSQMRDIRSQPASHVYESSATPDEELPYDQVEERVSRRESTDGKLSRVRTYIFSVVTVVVIIGIGFAATILLSGAEISVTPKSYATTVQANYDAKMKPGVGELGYDLLTLEELGDRQVQATGQEEVSVKATGNITIWNGLGGTSQPLIKNTRFESPAGLVYRISESVVVPGDKKNASGAITPGSVTATVFADGAGASYNMSAGRFTVPGLKDSEHYDKIYAEVATGGIAGGYEGPKFIIDETELSTTKQKLHNELRDTLLARIEKERPNGFVLYKDAITFTYESLPVQRAEGKAVIIKERALLHVPIFNEGSLASFLAKGTYPAYAGEPVRLENATSLTFTYIESTRADISKLESIQFSLSGPATIIWKFDEKALKRDVMGKPKKELSTVLSKYPAIERGSVDIQPIWKSNFPDTEAEIIVKEVLNPR